MPCRVDIPPTKEELEEINKVKTSPAYRNLYSLYEYAQERIKKLINLLKKKSNQTPTYQIGFDSFMTVFLCKAMKIIERENLIIDTYHEMEWWYNIHKKLDKGEEVNMKEVKAKLKDISERFTVKD